MKTKPVKMFICEGSFFANLTLLPVESSRHFARLLLAQETGSWPAARYSCFPASSSIPASPIGKINPKDAEIPLSADSHAVQNPPKDSNALSIPTSLTQNRDLRCTSSAPGAPFST